MDPIQWECCYRQVQNESGNSCNLWPAPLISTQINDVTRKSSSLTNTTNTHILTLQSISIKSFPIWYHYHDGGFFLACQDLGRRFIKSNSPPALFVLKWQSSFIIIIIYPLTTRVVGASRMTMQPVFFIFPCSPPLWDLPNSRPVHSLMLSSHLFLCLPCLLPPFTVPCKMVWARPDERETWHDIKGDWTQTN